MQLDLYLIVDALAILGVQLSTIKKDDTTYNFFCGGSTRFRFA